MHNSAGALGSVAFGGWDTAHYTPVPDDLFDTLLAQLSGAQLKVLLYIMRRTLGFGRRTDAISLAQLAHGIRRADGTVLDAGTGLSERAVIAAVKDLEAAGLIVAVRSLSARRGNIATSYSLGQSYDKMSDQSSARRGAGQNTFFSPQKSITPLHKSQTQETDPTGYTDQETDISNRADTEPISISRTRPPTAALPDSPPRPRTSPTIGVYMADFSREMGDLAHARANTTRAARLCHNAGLSDVVFVAHLNAAKHITRERQCGGAGVRNRMAYFFRVLENEVNGTPPPKETYPPTATAIAARGQPKADAPVAVAAPRHDYFQQAAGDVPSEAMSSAPPVLQAPVAGEWAEGRAALPPEVAPMIAAVVRDTPGRVRLRVRVAWQRDVLRAAHMARLSLCLSRAAAEPLVVEFA